MCIRYYGLWICKLYVKIKEKIRKNEVKYLFSIGNKMDKVHYIAKYYSLEAAAWFWATTNVVKTGMGSLNDYVNANGNSEAIFLITQYYVNGFTATDKDLATIRLGGEYKI